MSDLNFYPNLIHEGDANIDEDHDDGGSVYEIKSICEEIHDACEGFGTDENALLKVMGGLTPTQRCIVPLRYPQLYDGQELVRLVKSECGKRSDFSRALQLLSVDPVETDINIINLACKGMGTDELLLFTVICGRTNAEMSILKHQYFNLMTKDLGAKIDSELGGSLETLLFNVLQACQEEFDREFHTEEKMIEDMEQLYAMGQGSFGTDEKGLFKVLCARPPVYLKELNLKYADKYGYTLVMALQKELGGQVQEVALFMLGMKLKPYEEIAKLIKKACKGVGTNELLLTCTFVRYQRILPKVQEAHVELYGKTIRDRVREEVGGGYKRLLMEILEAVEN